MAEEFWIFYHGVILGLLIVEGLCVLVVVLFLLLAWVLPERFFLRLMQGISRGEIDPSEWTRKRPDG
jgi:hypothetical protein